MKKLFFYKKKNSVTLNNLIINIFLYECWKNIIQKNYGTG